MSSMASWLSDSSPHFIAPSFWLKPYWSTMALAILVAFSISLEAPVVGSWKTISSAVLPPMA